MCAPNSRLPADPLLPFCRLLSLILISFVPLGIKITSTEINDVTVQRQSTPHPFFQPLNLLAFHSNLLPGPALLLFIWVKKLPTKNAISVMDLVFMEGAKTVQEEEDNSHHKEVAESSAVQLNHHHSSY